MTMEQMGNCIVFLPNFDKDFQTIKIIVESETEYRLDSDSGAVFIARRFHPKFKDADCFKIGIAEGKIMYHLFANPEIKSYKHALTFGHDMFNLFKRIISDQGYINLVFPNNVVIKYKPKLQCKKK